MKKHILVFALGILVCGCSQFYNSRDSKGKLPKDHSTFETIDSNKVAAAVKPSDYRWNTEGCLVDLKRKENPPPVIDPRYPNPFSPPSYIWVYIMKSDTIKFYLCNTNESSCYKFQEGYLEQGNYSLGFQKLNIKRGIYILKIEEPDTSFSIEILLP